MSAGSQRLSGISTAWWLAAALLAIAAITACSSEVPNPTPVPPTSTPVPPTATPEEVDISQATGVLEEPEQEWETRTEDEDIKLILATPDLGPGTRRFAVVLTDTSGIVALPVVRMASFKYPEDSTSAQDREGPIETALARYYPFPYGTRGIHVTELTFDEPGMWGVEASVPRPDGEVATIEVLMEVHEQTMSVDVGQVPPLSVSRTLMDVEDVSDLTTGSNNDESLYQVTVAEALQNGKPTVVVFASPAFCTNAVCGPQVEVLSNLSAAYGDSANFIHVDLYVNPKEIQGDLSRAIQTPLLAEWGLVSQEWTFVMGADGKVVGRFENFVPEGELELSLMSVLNPEIVDDAEPDAKGSSESTDASVPPAEETASHNRELESEKDQSGTLKIEFDLDEGSVWRDAFEQFSGVEKQCIRDELGDEQLELVLGKLISSVDGSEAWKLGFAGCLESQTLKAIVLANTLAMTEPELTETGASCVAELIAETDIVAVINGEEIDAEPEDITAAGQYFAGLISCQLTDQLGSAEGLTASEQCFAELFETTDFAVVYAGQRPDANPESASKFEEFMNGMFGCLAGAMAMGLEGALEDTQESE